MGLLSATVARLPSYGSMPLSARCLSVAAGADAGAGAKPKRARSSSKAKPEAAASTASGDHHDHDHEVDELSLEESRRMQEHVRVDSAGAVRVPVCRVTVFIT